MMPSPASSIHVVGDCQTAYLPEKRAADQVIAGANAGSAQVKKTPQLFAGLVMFSNAAELCTLVLTGTLCAVCKISNPSERTQQQSWQWVLTIFCITLTFELLGDMSVIAVVHKRYVRRGRALPTVQSINKEIGRSVVILTISLGMLITTVLLATILMSMCPLGDQANNFLALTVCLSG